MKKFALTFAATAAAVLLTALPSHAASYFEYEDRSVYGSSQNDTSNSGGVIYMNYGDNGSGIIKTSTDVDYWAFQKPSTSTTTAKVYLSVPPDANLAFTVYDPDGFALITKNSTNALGGSETATLTNLTKWGWYKVKVFGMNGSYNTNALNYTLTVTAN